jgi:hypothetical protein
MHFVFWQKIVGVDENLSIVNDIYVLIFILAKTVLQQARNIKKTQIYCIFLSFLENFVQILKVFKARFNIIQNPKFLVFIWRIFFAVNFGAEIVWILKIGSYFWN